MSELEGRELDAAIEREFFGHTVEWRWCMPDYDGCGWMEIQSYEDLTEEEWKAHPAERRKDPCWCDGQIWLWVPEYHASMDAALELERDGWRWQFLQAHDDIEARLYTDPDSAGEAIVVVQPRLKGWPLIRVYATARCKCVLEALRKEKA